MFTARQSADTVTNSPTLYKVYKYTFNDNHETCSSNCNVYCTHKGDIRDYG